MRRFFMFLLLTLMFQQSMLAQVNPPNISCIEGNGTSIELFWQPPSNPCNTVVGYQVFFAQDANGPYQSFDIDNPSITDTTFSTTFDPVFCFMQSVINCPGQQVINSDTLIWDLTPPTVTSVSVNTNNQVEVSWEANPSPDVGAYLIYTNNNNIPDTVFGNTTTTFTDMVSDPDVSTHSYQIAWFRNCVRDSDRRGSLGQSYNTILAENLLQDECNRTFSFGWSRYENYTEGVRSYIIETNINNDGFNAVDTVPNDQLIYLFEDANNDDFYCFRVGALLPNDVIAYSNDVCDLAKVVDAPSGAHIMNATVSDSNTIVVSYVVDTSGVVDDLNFQRSVDGLTFQTWPANLIGTTNGNPDFDVYEDVTSSPQSQDFYYRFRRLDECGAEYFADSVRTIHLTAKLGFRLKAELNWNAYEVTNGNVVNYRLYKYVNGVGGLLATLPSTQLEYEEENALEYTSLDSVCYVVEATINLNLPGFPTISQTSQSNASCLEPTPRVIAPKAFMPTGNNRLFRPIISFGTDVDYNFRVYDRWNRKLYESNTPNEGWDGRIDGNLAPMDVYVYYVTFTGQDGLTYSKSGTVALIR